MENVWWKRIGIVLAALVPVAVIGALAFQSKDDATAQTAQDDTQQSPSFLKRQFGRLETAFSDDDDVPGVESESETDDDDVPAGTTGTSSTTTTTTGSTSTTGSTTTSGSGTSGSTSGSGSTGSTTTTAPTPSSTIPTGFKFTDGTYSATGSYTAPDGLQQIGVTLSVTDDKVTSVSITTKARGDSRSWQQFFAANVSTYVVGQPLATLHLTNVSGSSLTPIGFNNALETIKTDAAI